MKNIIKFLCVISLILIIGFSFVTCGGGGGPSGPGNDTNGLETVTYAGTAGNDIYVLVVTQNNARYVAKGGDTYELITESKTSRGNVQNVTNGALTLKPSNDSNTFKATVASGRLSKLEGKIKWADNTTSDAPGTLSEASNSISVTFPITKPVEYTRIENLADAKAKTNFSYILYVNTSYVTSVQNISTFFTPASIAVNNNNVTINLGTPTTEYLKPITLFSPDYTISSSDAKYFNIMLFSPDEHFSYLLHAGTERSDNWDLFYVDKDVKLVSSHYNCTFDLKQGWNYVSFGEDFPIGIKWVVNQNGY